MNMKNKIKVVTAIAASVAFAALLFVGVNNEWRLFYRYSHEEEIPGEWMVKDHSLFSGVSVDDKHFREVRIVWRGHGRPQRGQRVRIIRRVHLPLGPESGSYNQFFAEEGSWK